MPGVIAVSDFVRETREDINSPTTSGFVNRIPQCKETVHKLEEVRPDFIFFEYFFLKDLCEKCRFELDRTRQSYNKQCKETVVKFNDIFEYFSNKYFTNAHLL